MAIVRCIVDVAEGARVTWIDDHEGDAFDFMRCDLGLRRENPLLFHRPRNERLARTLVVSSITFTALMVRFSWMRCLCSPRALTTALSLNIESRQIFSSRSTDRSSMPMSFALYGTPSPSNFFALAPRQTAVKRTPTTKGTDQRWVSLWRRRRLAFSPRLLWLVWWLGHRPSCCNC